MTAIDLTAETPDPPPPSYIRALCERAGGQREAARRMHVDERTVRKWCAESGSSARSCPWVAADWLRKWVLEQAACP